MNTWSISTDVPRYSIRSKMLVSEGIVDGQSEFLIHNIFKCFNAKLADFSSPLQNSGDENMTTFDQVLILKK